MLTNGASITLLVLVAGCTAAPTKGTAVFTLPFELTDSNHIAIHALVNQQDPARLMFHTGAGSSVSITREAAEGMASVEWEQVDTVTSWGGTTPAGSSSGNSLEMGKRVWHDLRMGEVELSGGDTDGKFGPGLFAGEVLEFDFLQRTLTVHDGLPAFCRDFTRLDLTQRQGLLFLEAELDLGDEVVPVELMLHSGFGGSVLLEDAFAQDHDLAARLETLSVGELRDSYGNVLETREVSLPGLHLGDLRLERVPAGTFDGRVGQQRISVLGTAILSRFHVVLDMGNQRLYLRRSP